MRSFGLAVVIILLAVEPTMAADIASPPPPPPPAPAPPPIASPYSWSRLYGGVRLGGAWDDSEWRLFSQSGSGFLYGGQLGFNYQISQFVLGAEGDLSGSTLTADGICAANVGTNCQTQMNYLASVRARAGMAFDRLLVYGDGGVAFGGFKFAQTEGLLQSWDATTHIGWTAGTGVE
jgi:outer membrane immunogenic protein